MLDNYNSINNSKTINNSVHLKPVCVGTLQKSHNKSKFKRFHMNSPMSEWVFSDIPHISKIESNTYIEGSTYDGKKQKYITRGSEIVVLQLMCFGDNEIMIEYVSKSDYDMED